LGGVEACSPAYDIQLCAFNTVSISDTTADLLEDGSADFNFGNVHDQISTSCLVNDASQGHYEQCNGSKVKISD